MKIKNRNISKAEIYNQESSQNRSPARGTYCP